MIKQSKKKSKKKAVLWTDLYKEIHPLLSRKVSRRTTLLIPKDRNWEEVERALLCAVNEGLVVMDLEVTGMGDFRAWKSTGMKLVVEPDGSYHII